MGVTFNKDYCELNKMRDIGDLGIIKVTPFDYLLGSPWKDETWEMRLLNSEELLEIYIKYPNVAGTITEEAIQGQKIEMFIRSVVKRNGRPLVTQEDADSYNKAFSLSDTPNKLTTTELARAAAGELEQYVLNTWWAQYQILMGKQRNLIMGIVICKSCGKEWVVTEKLLPPIINFDEVENCPECNKELLIPKTPPSEPSKESSETLAEGIDLGGE